MDLFSASVSPMPDPDVKGSTSCTALLYPAQAEPGDAPVSKYAQSNSRPGRNTVSCRWGVPFNSLFALAHRTYVKQEYSMDIK
jgi:hypothetical protein